MTNNDGVTIGIIGGSGYIGSSVAKRLNDFEIKILDINPPERELRKSVKFENCDIRKLQDVKTALRDVDIVIHTAIIQIPAINEQPGRGYEVNVLGTQNVCQAIEQNAKTQGLILASSWHTIGERKLKGTIDEEFGYRPDKVEERAKLYVISKIAQETIVKFYSKMSEKNFGIIRMGTVLGAGMPNQTAASIFIEKGLTEKPITPYKHSMYRPMLYVDIEDVCKGFKVFSKKILKNKLTAESKKSSQVVNIYYPEPTTILELAEIVREAIVEQSEGNLTPEVMIVDQNQPSPFTKTDKKMFSADVSKALNFLELRKLKNPKESIEELVKVKLHQAESGDF